MKRQLNWIKPTHKKSFKSIARFKEKLPVPDVINLGQYCGPVLDQGDLGSCSANALGGAWAFLENRELSSKIDGPEVYNVSNFISPSRLFLYYQERVIEHDVNRDGGAMLSDGIKALMSVGCCDEDTWPYIVKQFNMRPPDSAYQEAAEHKISQFAELETLEDMDQCLANGLPFVLGFIVYPQFESDEMAKNGTLAMPQGRSIGGHAVLCIGRVAKPDKSIWYYIRNSYGFSWGVNGNFWMPAEYISNPDLCDEIYVISR